jgi:hypothetical protein
MTLKENETNALILLNTLDDEVTVRCIHATIKPLEKEIVIELPIPENQWQRIACMHFGRSRACIAYLF